MVKISKEKTSRLKKPNQGESRKTLVVVVVMVTEVIRGGSGKIRDQSEVRTTWEFWACKKV